MRAKERTALRKAVGRERQYTAERVAATCGDERFLNSDSEDPLDWECEPCLRGASCRSAVN